VKATVSTKDPPYIYNGQGPSAALLSGCILLRALKYTDILDEKLKEKDYRVQAKVKDQTRKDIVTELTNLMKQKNGFSPLSTTAKMVDPYNLLNLPGKDRFGEFPPELWLDIKRGGERYTF
jgi:hypothetical protein